MRLNGILANAIVLAIAFALSPDAPGQQSGQTGSGSGSSTGGSTGSTTGGSTGTTTGSRTTDRPQPNIGTQIERERQRMPYISGAVVMGDGSPIPPGIEIERVCSGQPRKEAYADSTGHFSFQAGANNNLAMQDASTSGWDSQDDPWDSMARSAGTPSRFRPPVSMALVGCEVRANLAGYRSSSVILSQSQATGPMLDVGVIVLYPLAKVTGTTVSATSLQAPKDAKKAFERAEKALRKQKFEEAEQNLQTAVGAYPRYADAWFALGRVYEQQRRTEDARAAFAKALEVDDHYVSPYIELARIAAVEQKWQEVVALTDRALTMNPLDFPDGYYLSSLANFRLNNAEAAESSARKAQRLDFQHRYPQVHLILASLLHQKQDSKGETEQLRKFLQYAPQSTSGPQVRARLSELEKAAGAVASKQEDRR